MTMIMEAFKRAGVHRALIEFDVAIAKLLNAGFTIEDAKARIALAEQRLPGGDKSAVPLGHALGSPSRQQNDDADQNSAANMATVAVSASSPLDAGWASDQLPKGRLRDAQPASPKLASGHPYGAPRAITTQPAREPSIADLSAMRAVRKESARVTLTVLDSWKVRDGRAIGDVSFSELDDLHFANAQEAALVDLIRKHAVHVERGARVRDVVKPEDLQRMIQKASEMVDAA